MKVQGMWQCELCNKEFDTPYAVRDEVCVMNGENARAYPYVCTKCTKKVVSMFDAEFPDNKFAARIRERERIAATIRPWVEKK